MMDKASSEKGGGRAATQKILLMGNPNVGKSIFFTELTGIHAISSNYAGTTVSFMEGRVALGDNQYNLIDVPGTYSLTPTSEAETVAASFLKEGAAAVICVLDASNLERNLHLALEIRKYNIPMVYTLNLADVAARHGIVVDADGLGRYLGAPVVLTVAVKKQGLDELKAHLEAILCEGAGIEAEALADGMSNSSIAVSNKVPQPVSDCGNCAVCLRGKSCNQATASVDQTNILSSDVATDTATDADIWTQAKKIANSVTTKSHSHPSFLDRLGEAMVRPFPGIPLAILVIALTIGVIVGGGRAIRAFALLPLINGVIVPFFRNIFTSLLPEGILLNILVGEFGIFVISFEWIIALIFPYVLMFYVVFTFLEDTGFLPRISVLFDNIMRKLGIQGGSLIHMIMGYGCAVPAIIGSRAATSRKERIVISAAICFAIPCISQTGAIISLLSAYAWWMLPAMLMFSLLLFCIVTLVIGKMVKGKVDPLLIEVPNLLMPNPKSYGRKLFTRMGHFMKDAEVPMLIAIVIAALLAESGILSLVATVAEPVVSRWLGLPEEAVIALILGIVRREMSVAPLLALDLTALQAFVGGAVSLLYLPCLSVFAILTKEFKVKIAVAISLSTVAVALLVGGLINHGVLLFL